MEEPKEFYDEDIDTIFNDDDEIYPDEESHVINPTNLFYEDGNYYLLKDGSYQVLPEELLDTLIKVRDENRQS